MTDTPAYLLIGNGRLARHFGHYFALLNIPFSSWQRSDGQADLANKVSLASHILLLISDQAIEDFIANNLTKTSAFLIHVSGSHVSERAYGAHPLMSFSNNDLYTLTQYQNIPFILDEHAPSFQTLLPGLPNPHVTLARELKAKYHALCVLAGNFSCMLWQKLFLSFTTELQLPAETAHPYLQQLTQNLIADPQAALTGPLVRNDEKTITKNLAALANDPFQNIYKSFIACYKQIHSEEK